MQWCGGKAPQPSVQQLCRHLGREPPPPVQRDEPPCDPTPEELEGRRPRSASPSPADEILGFSVASPRSAGAEARPDRLSEWFLLPSRERELGDRPTLVLDLDETLVRSIEVAPTPAEQARAATSGSGRPVVCGSPGAAFRLVWGDASCIQVYARPGLSRFLEYSRERFETVLWTAGTREYAEAVLSVIDEDSSVFAGRVVARDGRWFRPQPDGNGYAKDLRRLGRSMHRTILVDNTAEVCRRGFPNSVIVPDYLGPRTQRGRGDSVLSALERLLDEWLRTRRTAAAFITGSPLLRSTPAEGLPASEEDGPPLMYMLAPPELDDDSPDQRDPAGPPAGSGARRRLQVPAARY